MNKKFSIVVAVDSKNGIGKNGGLAWNLFKDMKYFKEVTTKNEDLGKLNAVIMGKNTWESIPSKFKPLSDRINCILSSKIKQNSKNSKLDDFVLYFESLESCLSELEIKTNLDKIFIIGGSVLYNLVINNPILEKIYITKIEGDFGCDVFFPGIPDNFYKIEESEQLEENGIKFRFETYRREKYL